MARTYGTIPTRVSVEELVEFINANPPAIQRLVDVRDPAYGAAGDGETDDTEALQAAIDAASSATSAEASVVVLPPGDFRITDTLTFPNQYVTIRGAGVHATRITADITGSAPYFQRTANAYFSGHVSDFSLVGGASATGIAFDLDDQGSTPDPLEVWQATFRRLYIESGGACLYGQYVFNTLFEDLHGTSANDHAFKVHCGNTTVWRNCYAKSVPAGKAGYRLSGFIQLESCNGINEGGYWGVFGNRPALSDGFQTDFPDIAENYPVIQLLNCNVEHFTTCGIYVNTAFVLCDILGGKIDRASPSLPSGYHSLIRVRTTSLGANRPVRISAYVLPGGGVPNGGAGLTAAHLYADNGAFFEDVSGSLTANGVTKYYDAAAAIYYPLPSPRYAGDVYGDSARYFDAVQARRISARVLRYDTPAPLTPVGTDQTITVTGYTKVTVTPAAAATVAHATFDATGGTGAATDYGRNGELIIEAGNGNLTLVHNHAGQGGFRMKAAADKVMAAGEIARFVWSANYTAGVGGWVEA